LNENSGIATLRGSRGYRRFLRGRSRTISLRGLFVNPCKLPMSLHHAAFRSLCRPRKALAIVSSMLVDSGNLYTHPDFSVSSSFRHPRSLPFLHAVLTARAHLSLSLRSQDPGAPRSRSPVLGRVCHRIAQFSAHGRVLLPCARQKRRQSQSFGIVTVSNDRACQTERRYGHAVIAIASDRDASIVAL
jgi:hypothetical protein